MGVLAQMAPQIANVCGEVVKLIILRGTHAPLSALPQTSAAKGGESPLHSDGCPYCAISRHLSVAHRYLSRGAERESFASTYQELARQEALAATYDTVTLPSPLDIRNLRLTKQLHELEVALSRPLRSYEFRQLATSVWNTTELSLDLAEQYQSQIHALDREAEDLDQRIEDLAANTVEGTATVLG